MFRININNQSFSCAEEVNLLKAARTQMIKVPYGCASGGCGVCKVKIAEGNYKMEVYSKQALKDEERSSGVVLLCKTFPLSHIQAELMD